MEWWKRIKIVVAQFFIGCGSLIVGHVIFKILVNRVYEIDAIHWYALVFGVYAALSGLLFYRRQKMTHRQFQKRLLLQIGVTLLFAGFLYGTDAFELSKASNPILETVISCSVFFGMYLIIIVIICRIQRDLECSREMNEALQHYRGKSAKKNGFSSTQENS